MALLFHLSDLHIDSANTGQRVLFDVLVETLGREKARSDATHTALVITGDVFDSSTARPRVVIPLFLDLHARIVAALGCAAPTIVLPGNHDRRWRGLVGPHRTRLFKALQDSVDPRSIYVAGCRAPFLAEVVPPSFHGLPTDVVAYDSTYLPHGWVSAGGMIRQQDLLQAHAGLDPDRTARPLLFLVHHHLIPTPLTDVSFIDSAGSMPRAVRWLLGRVLPAIVSNADREELTMTALGAGTALSTLHTFGRAVLLLHGHKHFPTARLLRGLVEESGDILVASAGSGGQRERLHGTHDPDAVRLWPSFNVVRIEEERLTIESVSFSPKRSTRRAVRRDLATAKRRDHRWEPGAVSTRMRDITKRVERDEARFVLSSSRAGSAATWDYVCERTVVLSPGAKLGRYVEFVPVHVERARIRTSASRRRIELRTDGVTRYAVADGLRRTAGSLAEARGASQAFEWVGLLSRYGGSSVALALARAQAGDLAPFGSVTDLGTGREWPIAVRVTSDDWSIRLEGCAPRTLLRLYWPLGG